MVWTLNNKEREASFPEGEGEPDEFEEEGRGEAENNSLQNYQQTGRCA
jgi:hypothetical protein